MKPPEVSYARSGDVAIAYQVVGAGSPDIVFVRGITGDLVSTWEQPLLVRHVQGLAALGRVLMLDKRGTGLSDRVREVHAMFPEIAFVLLLVPFESHNFIVSQILASVWAEVIIA